MTLEAAAVDTLDVGRIALMSRDIDGIERAIILVALMMLAVFDGTVDMIISGSFVIHCFHLDLIILDGIAGTELKSALVCKPQGIIPFLSG